MILIWQFLCRILNFNENLFSPRWYKIGQFFLACQEKPQTKWQNDLTPWRRTLIFIQKQSLGAKVQTVVMSSYENYLKFDQCNCSNSTSSCKLPNGTLPDIDIGKYVDFSKLYNIPLLYILLGFLLLIILYVVVESFVGKQISMKRFILGPQNERNGSTINNEGWCDLTYMPY